MSTDTKTQRAVRFYPPAYDIRVEDVPIPEIEHPDDAIVKVTLAGLCGSDLHGYRGHAGIPVPIICGHEFLGEITSLGTNFQPSVTGRPEGYAELRVGDQVIAPFTVSCRECRPCRAGFSSRCIHSTLFGSPALPGGQAQYVRVPKAGGTLFKVDSIFSSTSSPSKSPGSEQKISNSSLLLLADILPTGVFAALQALQHLKMAPFVRGEVFPFGGAFMPTRGPLSESGGSDQSSRKLGFWEKLAVEERTVVVGIVGLGPVGLCAAVSLLDMLEELRRKEGVSYRVVAIDLIEARREKMKKILDAIRTTSTDTTSGVDHGSLVPVVEVADIEEGKTLVEKWTDGLGCHAILEVVGNPKALSLSYSLLRPFGILTSVGVHPSLPVPFTGSELYDKNISLDFGRCPVRAILPLAAELLMKRQDVFGGVGGEVSLVEKVVGLEDAKESYEQFEKGACGKILFEPWR